MKQNKSIKWKKTDYYIISVIILIFLLVIFLNSRLITRLLVSQTQKVGQAQLDMIRSEFVSNMSMTEQTLLDVANEAEEIIEAGTENEELEQYIIQRKKEEIDNSRGVNFNVYIAGEGWYIIPDFDAPADYHVNERSWYVGAIENAGDIYVTSPYIDSMTGDMCYTMSVMLPDGETVVGMDFNFSKIQQSIENMTGDGNSTAMIVTEDGMIVGYTDMSYVGKELAKDLPDYSDVLNLIKRNPNGDSIKYTIDKTRYTVFYSMTDNGWYMILCVDSRELYEDIIAQVVYTIGINVLLLILVVLFFLRSAGNSAKAEEALKSREAFVNKISNNLREPINKIIRLSDNSQKLETTNIQEDMVEIRSSGMRLRSMIDDLGFYSSIVSDMNKAEQETEQRNKQLTRSIRTFRNIIIGILVALTVFNCFYIYDTNSDLALTDVAENTDYYYREYALWQKEQMTVVNMYADAIAAQPELMDDYDRAVKWLDDIAKKYPDISVCYMTNPYKEHTVIMNNGWQPDDDWKVEERDWYKKTEISPNGFAISAPYYDEQTGNYCITMSKIVYGQKGEFLGIFGIDFYMEKLIDIFGGAYSSREYVFMVDPNGAIINHPNAAYQMSADNTVYISDTAYSDISVAKERSNYKDNVSAIRDYSDGLVLCSGIEDIESGFRIYYAANFWDMTWMIVLLEVIYVVVSITFLMIMIMLLNKVIKSQADMNAELEAAVERATAAGKAKSDFLAQMSHEIRTPINAIIGMDEIIYRESDDSNIREYAVDIKNASNTLLYLVNGVLDFSKIESGKMEIIPVDYDSVSFLESLINMVSDRIEKKGLEFILDIDTHLPKLLHGDDMRLRQVILNLLTNAAKYTEEGSVRFTVRAEDKTQSECTLFVEVSDTGVGIKKEDMEKLFESFRRIDEDKNRTIEGTGLGMSIVKGMLDLMDSSLNVESEYGKGSTFSFKVKQGITDSEEIGEFKKQRIGEENTKLQRKIIMNDAKILVVDDNSMNLKVAKGLLKKYGIVPVLSDSGRDAIEKVKNNYFDIIFMDHMMPDLDGISTLEMMNEQGLLLYSTVVIALTANAVVGAKEMYMEKGFTDYMSKPIKPEILEKFLLKYVPEEDYQIIEPTEDDETKAVLNKALDEAGLAGIVEAVAEMEEAIEAENVVGTTNAVEIENVVETTKSETNGNSQEVTGLDLLRKYGFNVTAGLEYSMNDEEFYKEVLGTFVESAPEKIDNLNKAFDNEDWYEYQIQVHGLKSAARTIGGDTLADMAYEHEKSAKEENGTYIKENYQLLMNIYKDVVDLIKRACE